MGGHVERMAEVRNAYKIVVGRPEEKRPLFCDVCDICSNGNKR
jgi:hypothetical protein